jgi:hypothetical protein
VDVEEVFTHEYIGTDRLHITNGDKTDEKAITEWRKTVESYSTKKYIFLKEYFNFPVFRF